ncbi:MAG: bile acid-coenzyme ligase [Actinomycetota bacterium]|nr:bile acid-coenzyme ligase [Actinomycetota bacterium]
MVSYARRLADDAAADPDRLAVTDEHRSVTRAELDALANRTARAFAERGVGQGDVVTIALPNSVEFIAAVVAAWKLGATPQPVSSRLPRRELDGIIELAQPKVIVGVEPSDHPDHACLAPGWEPDPTLESGPLPDATSNPWKAMTSGGSTGRPKLIITNAPAEIDPDAAPLLSIRRNGTHMMPGPLYHNGPFVWTTVALLAGNHVVLGGRFDAERTLALIDRHHADSMYIVPTMMQRIWRLPDDVRARYDVTSLRVVWHLAAPCPAWLKEAWIDWLGAETIFELYGGTEAQASTVITGPQWLTHRGSVGRPIAGEIKIVGPDGQDLPPGEVGELYLRPSDPATKTYRYVGAEAKTLGDRWESLGDMGWMDAEGYLYLTDRQADMILVGGSNVYPAEIESALDEHPRVRSCAVIGLPDDDLGNRVHAIVQTDDGSALDVDELRTFLDERLVRYKVPRTFEFVREPLRDDAGKLRRSALRADRL